MRYEILGPLRVTDGNELLTFAPGKIQILLTVLIIRSDRVVPSEQLIAEIWGEGAPPRAAEGLHVYISRLRKLLSRFTPEAGPIITEAPGYRLAVGGDDIDLRTFKDLMDAGRAHAKAGRLHETIDALEGALRQCRSGSTLADISGGPVINGFLPWLEEAHMECTEMLFEVKLMLGRHRQLIADLHALTTRHHLRESFYRQLMLALYRSDRQADALEVYRSARASLNKHLGVEPGRALQELQQAILAADERLYTPAPDGPLHDQRYVPARPLLSDSGPVSARSATVPRQARAVHRTRQLAPRRALRGPDPTQGEPKQCP